MKNIVFVCVENSCRSQLAEALAKIQVAKMPADNPVAIFSAGSKPSGKVNDKAIESMARIGYDLSAHSSESLDSLPKVNFDAVITMGCGDECPLIRGEIKEDWGLPDPKLMSQEDFDDQRNMIEERVRALLQKLDEAK